MTDKSHIYKYFEKSNIDNHDDTTWICKICKENGKKDPTIKAARTSNLVTHMRSAFAGHAEALIEYNFSNIDSPNRMRPNKRKCIESPQTSTLVSQNMVKKIQYNFNGYQQKEQ